MCPDFSVSIRDITPLRLNRPRLGRALATALSCEPKIRNLSLPQTVQFGWWSCDQVPAIMTIQSDPHEFRRVIAELVARLRRPFILFAPTADHLDAECQELLATVQAGFFAIESTFTLTDHGLVVVRQPPGELLARFTPQPKEIDQDVAGQVVRLASQLGAETIEVFRLYCLEGLSAAQVARKSGWSKATVIRRLKVIRGKTGMDPRSLRTLSPHLEKAEHELADSRAAHIHRKRLIYDDPGAEGEGE